jgi:hypothetical protein
LSYQVLVDFPSRSYQVLVDSPTKCSWISVDNTRVLHIRHATALLKRQKNESFSLRRWGGGGSAVGCDGGSCPCRRARSGHADRRCARPVQGQPELTLEIVHAAVIGAELVFEGSPCDECGFPRVYAPQTLCQPCVDIESKGAFFQRPMASRLSRTACSRRLRK